MKRQPPFHRRAPPAVDIEMIIITAISKQPYARVAKTAVGSFDKTSNEAGLEHATNGDPPPELDSAVDCAESGNVKLALRFLRLAKFDNGVFERLNRYETSLWRQVAHLLFALNFFHQPQRRHSAFPTRRDNPFLFR